MFSFTESKINPAYLGNRIKRLLAFCIDIFPINFIVITIYRQYSEYDKLMEPLLLDPSNPELQAAIMPMMNTIGMIGGGVYLIYCFLMEASVYQATYGKRLMRLKVISSEGETITPQEAFWRNAFKILSHSLASVGFFWILFDRQKRGWHDILGKTLVVDQDYETTNTTETQISKPTTNKELVEFKSIYSGNQSNLLFPSSITIEKLKEIQEKYPLGETVGKSNRFAEYVEIFDDELLDSNVDMDYDLLWNNATLGQKVLRTFIDFNEQINNGGLKQFIFNCPELIFAAEQMLQEVNDDKLLADYRAGLIDLYTNADELQEIKETLDGSIIDWEDRWNEFQQSTEMGPSSQSIEEYYWDKEYQSALYTTVCHYIESHIDMFMEAK